MEDLSFVLRLKDYLAPALKRTAAEARNVFGQIDNTLKGTQCYLDRLAEARKIQLDSSDLDRAHSKMKEMGSTWDVLRGTMMGQMAFEGVERAFGAAKNFLQSSVMAGMEEERTKMLMQVMKGDHGGIDLYGQIKSNLLQSLYGTQLYGVGKAMTAQGMQTPDVMRHIRMFEDLASGDAWAMQQLMDSYELIRGEKHLTQITERPLLGMGFDPSMTLTRKYGGKQDDWEAKLRDSTNGLQYFEMALQAATEQGGLFYKAQEKLAETPYGKYTVAMTNWENMKAEWGEKLLPELGKLLDHLKPALDRLPDLLDRMVGPLGRLGDKVVDLIDWMSKNTSTIKEWVKDAVWWTKALIAVSAANLLNKTASGFLNGLAGATSGGVAAAGEGGLAAIAGAGGLEAVAGAGIAATGGLAALIGLVGWGAWEIWTHHGDGKNRHYINWNPNGPSTPSAVAVASGKVIADVKNRLGITPGFLQAFNSRDIYDPNPSYTRYSLPSKAGQALMGMGRGALSVQGGAAGKGSSGMDAGSGTADAIIGGGSKVVNINIKSFVEKMENHYANLTDGVNDAEAKFREMFLRVLHSADHAL